MDRRLVTFLWGITFRNWRRLLRENHFHIDRDYGPRAALISTLSVWNSLLGRREEDAFGAQIAAAAVEAPLFILGHWGSGTTHLHLLLALDRRFAYPNLYQIANPHTFLLTENAAQRRLAPWMPRQRRWDNVAVSLQMPTEDEFATCLAGLRSPYLSWAFPQREAHYDQFLSFREAAPRDVQHWKSALCWFLRKLTCKYHRPLLLKSPPHTARLRLLLELFPRARFVHLHRHPFSVFQSTRRLHQKALPCFHLQRPNAAHLESGILSRYRLMHDALFEQRALVPDGQWCEVAFEDVEADPIGQVRRIYRELDLPAFERVQPALEDYVRGLADYRQNEHPPLAPALRREIAQAWQRSFEEWNYSC